MKQQVTEYVEWATSDEGTKDFDRKSAKKLNEWVKGEKATFFFQGIKEYESKYNKPGTKNKDVIRYVVTCPAFVKDGKVSSTEEIVTYRANDALLDRVRDLKDGQLIEIECMGEKESSNGYKYVGFRTVRVGNNCYIFENETEA